MNAERLAFRNGTFDRAVMLFAIAGLPDPVRAVTEMMRVVRPGGTIVIAGHFRSSRLRDRFISAMLAPLYRLLCYRQKLDCGGLLSACSLELISARRVNLFGYSTVLRCLNPPALPAAVPGEMEPIERAPAVLPADYRFKLPS
jgi:phosphatidylethanolamine/phosphatidyl-N-methylethanolamine N-methyltransferase